MKKSEYIFENELFYALLHNNYRQTIIDSVIEQFKSKGPSYVLCKVSDEARIFRNWARQVKTERQRAISFIRLQPVEQKRVLFGEFEVKHKTQELIMLHFMKRFPTYAILIFFGEEAFIGRDGEIFKDKVKKPQIPQIKDNFEDYWRTFYKSQYIPERKNLKYLQRMLPKKYWKWTPELLELLT